MVMSWVYDMIHNINQYFKNKSNFSILLHFIEQKYFFNPILANATINYYILSNIIEKESGRGIRQKIQLKN